MLYDGGGGNTNYRLIYQTTGEASLSHASGESTPYYPLKVPDGKTKVVITIPALTSDQKLYMTVYGLTLENRIYTRATSSGWLTAGVYEYTLPSGMAYIAMNFRNESYSALDSYDFTGFTVTWE